MGIKAKSQYKEERASRSFATGFINPRDWIHESNFDKNLRFSADCFIHNSGFFLKLDFWVQFLQPGGGDCSVVHLSIFVPMLIDAFYSVFYSNMLMKYFVAFWNRL